MSAALCDVCCALCAEAFYRQIWSIWKGLGFRLSPTMKASDIGLPSSPEERMNSVDVFIPLSGELDADVRAFINRP